MRDDTAAASTPLPTTDLAPSLARAFLREVLGRHHLLAVEGDAALLMTEVVTNAVHHGGPPLGLRIGCTDRVLRVSVSDSSSRPPATGTGDMLDTSGRGMVLVEALADDWGVEQHPGNGKDVWFTLS